jgi:hypothetical protein
MSSTSPRVAARADQVSSDTQSSIHKSSTAGRSLVSASDQDATVGQRADLGLCDAHSECERGVDHRAAKGLARGDERITEPQALVKLSRVAAAGQFLAPKRSSEDDQDLRHDDRRSSRARRSGCATPAPSVEVVRVRGANSRGSTGRAECDRVASSLTSRCRRA